MPETASHDGVLPSGSRYVVEVPARWNGVLVLLSRPVPVEPDEPPWSGDPLVDRLVGNGYAVAGSANTVFWPLERAFADQPALLDVAGRLLGPCRHTVAIGMSIGGTITAGLVQLFPDRLSGALPMCGNLAGAVATHNAELDIAFVVKTLLAPESGLRVTGITEPFTNLELAVDVLHEAQATSSGRARLALAAATGNIPGWHDPASLPPAAEDSAARQRNQFSWFEQMGFLVFFWARAQVERQAGGNPSWNTDVDYGGLLASSINRDEVEALYGAADLDLDHDLGRLAAEPRIEADPVAVDYLERHIVFSGDLGGVPVLTVHTDGDGIVTPEHERAYAEVVTHAGDQDLLRQLFVHRGGHCTFTIGEILTALEALLERIESGSWPRLDPETMNAAALRSGAGGAEADSPVSGVPVPPGFLAFAPQPFRRRYDARDMKG